MKLILAATICVTLAGCIGNSTPRLVGDPVSSVKSALPPGWTILDVQENTHPFYRPKAKGRAIFLGVLGRKYGKAQFSAVLYIMPSDYEDDGKDPASVTRRETQTYPPQLISDSSDAKLYLWGHLGVGPEEWTTIKEDLLKALVK